MSDIHFTISSVTYVLWERKRHLHFVSHGEDERVSAPDLRIRIMDKWIHTLAVVTIQISGHKVITMLANVARKKFCQQLSASQSSTVPCI